MPLLIPTPDPESWLSASEQLRFQRLKAAPRRAQYLAGHWLLRLLLAEYAGGQPSDWRLQERENLPPSVPDSSIRCALSHSGDWLAAGISLVPLGVDLETRQSERSLRRLEPLLRALDDPPNALDDDLLLQRWVVKEALIKRVEGSALPNQISAIQLRRAHTEQGRVAELLTTASFHLAIASERPVHMDIVEPIQHRQWWECRGIALV